MVDFRTLARPSVAVTGSIADVAQRTGASLVEALLSASHVILLDVSISMAEHDTPDGRSRFEVARDELRKLQERLPGRVAIVAFSDDAQLCPNGTPTQPSGGTNLAGALRHIRSFAIGTGIVVVSDGEPSDAEAATIAARDLQTKIDTVYVGPDSDRYGGRAFLAYLASLYGGQAVTADRAAALAEHVERLMLGAGS